MWPLVCRGVCACRKARMSRPPRTTYVLMAGANWAFCLSHSGGRSRATARRQLTLTVGEGRRLTPPAANAAGVNFVYHSTFKVGRAQLNWAMLTPDGHLLKDKKLGKQSNVCRKLIFLLILSLQTQEKSEFLSLTCLSFRKLLCVSKANMLSGSGAWLLRHMRQACCPLLPKEMKGFTRSGIHNSRGPYPICSECCFLFFFPKGKNPFTGACT